MNRRAAEEVARWEPIGFGALTLIAASIVVFLPTIPGHDVPQHLAYVRLILDWQTDPARLAEIYTTPDLSNVYGTLYRVMAFVAGFSSPDTSLRVVLAVYVILLSIAVRSLIRATWRTSHPSTAVLGPVVSLNPVLCMGLLAYVVAIVPLVGGVAAAIDLAATGRRRSLALVFVCAFCAATCHGVAGAALLLFLGLFVIASPPVGRWRSASAFGIGVAGVVLNGVILGPAVPHRTELGETLLANMRIHGLAAGFIGTFRISFTHWLQKAEQIAASLLGPFPLAEKVAVVWLAAIVFTIWLRAREDHSRRADDGATPPTVRRALAMFAFAAILAPAALQIPDDLSLLDFRLITTATILAVAVLSPRVFAHSRSAMIALGTASLVVLGLWARQLGGAAGEVMETVRLLERLQPTDRLLALPMRDRSAFLDERNAVLHYAAVHHTIRGGGVTSLFWGRFSTRLPVGYQPGREPAHPADWAPWELTEEQLDGFTHVIVRWPDPADHEEPRLRQLADHITTLRDEGRLQTIACEGDSCLFSVSRAPACSASAGRQTVTGLARARSGVAP